MDLLKHFRRDLSQAINRDDLLIDEKAHAVREILLQNVDLLNHVDCRKTMKIKLNLLLTEAWNANLLETRWLLDDFYDCIDAGASCK